VTSLSPPNTKLVERLTPFAVATPSVRERLDLRPFGHSISAANVFDPLRGESSVILERLRTLDAAAFGPGEMAMPRWILLDGAGLSGAIIGLAAPVERASDSVLELLGIERRERGLAPHSMYIAIPSFERDTWVGHNLASLAARRPAGEDLRGLGGLTKAIALRALGARRQLGAAQWDSVALRVHVRLGALRLLTAWTPAHTKPWTFTYAAEIDEARLRHLARDPAGGVSLPEPVRWLRCDDHGGMQALQRDIEGGETWCIAGPPSAAEGAPPSVPLARS
jgi:hypothetical protein